MMQHMKTLLIDNYDSFTYNLFHMIAVVNGESPLVIRNDELRWDALQALAFDNIVISPGPGHPDHPADFGVCRRIIEEMTCPILGICLGHQGIVSVCGGHVIRAPEPMHGRISEIMHHDDALFKNVPAIFQAVRYHSLIGDRESLPSCLSITAETQDKIIMAIRHTSRPLWGLQFHPESISSEHGLTILQNFKQQTASVPVRERSVLKVSGKSRPQKIKVLTKTMTTTNTPLQIYDHLYPDKINTIWLDSSKCIQDYSRFSFLGSMDEGPLSHLLQYHVSTQTIKKTQKGVITYHHEKLLDYLQKQLTFYQPETTVLPFDFIGGFVGYLGYELKQDTLGIQNQYSSSQPDASLLFLDRLIVFDHQEQTVTLVALTPMEYEQEAAKWLRATAEKLHSVIPEQKREYSQHASTPATFSRDQKNYLQDIEQCLQYIQAGESYEMCLTNKLHFQMDSDPFHYYALLRQKNPTPYAAYLCFADCTIASSSMERFLRIDTQGNIESKPIKGTLPRGNTPAEDESFKSSLRNDEKFRAENLMIVDLVRNDFSRVCEIGSVHVPALMQVESYQTVHQLVSTIRGKLRHDCDAVDCIKATFPGGSMTGAPKYRTVMLLEALEKEPRGIYSGAIGYLSLNGAADFNIVIRTAVFTPNHITIGVGGAITSLSIPQEEFDEILLKAKVLESILAHP